jgi:hypothetical protein
VVAAYAIVDAASQLWRLCLLALRVEKSVLKSTRGEFEAFEVFRSGEFPEKISPATRKPPPPIHLLELVAELHALAELVL